MQVVVEKVRTFFRGLLLLCGDSKLLLSSSDTTPLVICGIASHVRVVLFSVLHNRHFKSVQATQGRHVAYATA